MDQARARSQLVVNMDIIVTMNIPEDLIIKTTGVRMNKFYEILRNEDYKPFVETKGGSNFSADYVSWAVMHDYLKKNFQYHICCYQIVLQQ